MSAPLDDATRAIIRATVPALKAHGVDITTEMYKRLLAHTQIRDLFNMSHQRDGAHKIVVQPALQAKHRGRFNAQRLVGQAQRLGGVETHGGDSIDSPRGRLFASMPG